MILDREKLDQILNNKDMSLAQLAHDCGISRQSIYNMFIGKSFLSAPLEKMLDFLNIDLEDVLERRSSLELILGNAPEKIRNAVLKLQKYAELNKADLFLVGSRARGKRTIRSDWDFVVFFPKNKKVKGIASFKQKISDIAFPYKIDVVTLNQAPTWFIDSVSNEAIRVTGSTDPKIVFSKKRERKSAA